MKNRKSIYMSSVFGFIAFLCAFTLGSILTISTGIPLIGGLLNGILTGMILSVGMLSRDFNFNATIMWFVFSFFASITTTLGPPGFYKIFIGLLAGLCWDLFYAFFSGFKKWGLYLGGILGSASIMFSLIFFLRMGFGKSAVEALEKYNSKFQVILVMNLVITLIGIILGHLLFTKRLEKLPQFKNLRE